MSVVDKRTKAAFRRVRLAHTRDDIGNMTNVELAQAIQGELEADESALGLPPVAGRRGAAAPQPRRRLAGAAGRKG